MLSLDDIKQIDLMSKSPFLILMLFAVFALLCGTCYAAEVNDGFSEARRIESRYFTILLESGVDTDELAMRIYVPAGIKAIIKNPLASSLSDSIADQFDILFIAVSEMLDIRLKKFNYKVKICKNAVRLSEVAERLFGHPIQSSSLGGFCIPQINTLYVDAENINLNILGHEMSHAVLCNYFVIPPPEKLQEVLSGYVEYQFRKHTGTLPKER